MSTNTARILHFAPYSEDLKEVVKEAYMKQKVVNLHNLAPKFGVPKSIVAQWIKEGHWLEVRKAWRNSQRMDLFERIGETPDEAAEAEYKFYKTLRDRCEEYLKENPKISPAGMREMANLMATAQKFCERSRKALKI
jgi:hypothetical protein